MKQTFGQYIQANKGFLLVIVVCIGLWWAAIANPEFWFLWVMAVAATIFSLIGLFRNLAGKDGTWNG